MSFLFGASRRSPAEEMRKNVRAIEHAMRDLDRERGKMQAQESKLLRDIKTTARNGQMSACRIMAKDLVRTRAHISNFGKMKGNLQAMCLKIKTMQSSEAMTRAMCGVTKALKNLNARNNLPSIAKIAAEFEKQSEIMDIKSEMISDAVDDALDDPADAGLDENEDELLSKIFDEIGIEKSIQMVSAPNTAGLKAVSSANPIAAVPVEEPVLLGATSEAPITNNNNNSNSFTNNSSSSSNNNNNNNNSSNADDAALLARLEMLKKP